MQNREPSSADQGAMIALMGRLWQAEQSNDLDQVFELTGRDPAFSWIHMPTACGGRGHAEFQRVYRTLSENGFYPPEHDIQVVTRTVSDDRVILEIMVTFEHTQPMEWILPGVAPTGKRVELALVLVVEFRGGNIHSERMYWDQASVLVQVGLLDPAGLPVVPGNGRLIVDESMPLNTLLDR